MTKPEWRRDGDTIYSVSLAGFRVVVYAGGAPCIWRMKFGLPPGDAETFDLAATNARDAKVEALEFVRGWATELVAKAAELRFLVEVDDEDTEDES